MKCLRLYVRVCNVIAGIGSQLVILAANQDGYYIHIYSISEDV